MNKWERGDLFFKSSNYVMCLFCVVGIHDDVLNIVELARYSKQFYKTRIPNDNFFHNYSWHYVENVDLEYVSDVMKVQLTSLPKQIQDHYYEFKSKMLDTDLL